MTQVGRYRVFVRQFVPSGPYFTSLENTERLKGYEWSPFNRSFPSEGDARAAGEDYAAYLMSNNP